MKKIDNTFKFLARLKKRLGKDLVYSMALDVDNTFYLSVSTHKSPNRKFKDDKLHPCKLTQKDFEKHDFLLLEEIANIYENLLEKVDNK